MHNAVSGTYQALRKIRLPHLDWSLWLSNAGLLFPGSEAELISFSPIFTELCCMTCIDQWHISTSDTRRDKHCILGLVLFLCCDHHVKQSWQTCGRGSFHTNFQICEWSHLELPASAKPHISIVEKVTTDETKQSPAQNINPENYEQVNKSNLKSLSFNEVWCIAI